MIGRMRYRRAVRARLLALMRAQDKHASETRAERERALLAHERARQDALWARRDG